MTIKIVRKSKLQAGSGAKLTRADGNTLIEADGEGGGDFESRVAALEAILDGFSEQTLDVCDGGTPDTVIFLTK